MGSDTNLTPEFAFHLGKSFGTFLIRNAQSQIWICRDARLSSPSLHESLIHGLLDTGVEVLDLGVGPTPLLCHAIAKRPEAYKTASSGIMITASHNPPNHNGFKITFDGMPFYGDELARLRQIMISGDYHQGLGAHRTVDHQSTYLKDFQTRVKRLQSGNKNIRIVVDAANGAAGPLAIAALNAIGAEVIPLFCEMDGSFPNHSPDTSNPENLKDLINKVIEVDAFCGIALDGDGDRMVAVAETGEILNADDLMALFSSDVLDNIPCATIVFDVKTSNQLVTQIKDKGGTPFMTKSGRSYIQEAMFKEGAALAGEFSSHFFFADKWYGSDDGIYAAARLLEICLGLGKPLSLACEKAQALYATDEIGIAVDEKRKFEIVRDIVANSRFEGANLVTIDGLRIEYPASWALVRASNTSASLTLRFEADSQTELNRLMTLIRHELLKIEPNLDLRKLNVA